MFSEFDNYLNLDFLVDYWYDEGMGIASTLLAKFGEQDWKELKEHCLSRTDAWNIRCAEVLDLVNHPISTEILIKLLGSKDGDVTVAAADSLRSKGDIHLSEDSIERLRFLLEQGSTPVKIILNNLLSQIYAT